MKYQCRDCSATDDTDEAHCRVHIQASHIVKEDLSINERVLLMASGQMAQDPVFAAWMVEEFGDAIVKIANRLRNGVPSEDADEEGGGPTDEQFYELVHATGKLSDGELEMDHGATISRGGDNGAYVQCWLWVSYAGTPFDKDKESEEKP